MKKYILLPLAFLFSSSLLFAQSSSSLTGLLDQYYGIKEALVAGNKEKAAGAVRGLAKTLSSMGQELTPAEKKILAELQPSLQASVSELAKASSLAAQRQAFSSFSQQMITLARSAPLSAKEVQVMYCPMKKAYWLSAEKAIKNPYYGSSMLTCGQITETIRK